MSPPSDRPGVDARGPCQGIAQALQPQSPQGDFFGSSHHHSAHHQASGSRYQQPAHRAADFGPWGNPYGGMTASMISTAAFQVPSSSFPSSFPSSFLSPFPSLLFALKQEDMWVQLPTAMGYAQQFPASAQRNSTFQLYGAGNPYATAAANVAPVNKCL